jgi:hypothetical protein
MQCNPGEGAIRESDSVERAPHPSRCFASAFFIKNGGHGPPMPLPAKGGEREK